MRLVLIINLLGMGLLLIAASKNNSPTSDEPPHLLSGYTALINGHDYIDIEHPLLAKTYAATPLLFQYVKIDLKDPNYTTQKDLLNIGKLFKTSRNFLTYQDNQTDQILFSARFMMILATVGFGVVIFLFTKKLFGELAGLLAVFLYSTESVILANGSLVNTDLAAAIFTTLTIFALLLYSEEQTRKNLIFLTAALLAGLLSKFSTFFLLPIVLVSMELIYRHSKFHPRKHMLYLVGGILVGISVFYGLLAFRDRGIVGFWPKSYFLGFYEVFRFVSGLSRPAYLLGENYLGGRWYYFPVLILLKTQILTLVGGLIAVILFFKQRLLINKSSLLICLLPISLFFLTAVLSKSNIGLRHVLPLYPFLIIFAAGGLAKLIDLVRTNFHLPHCAIGFIIIFIILVRFWSVITTYPHYLSYFNFIAGGTDKGWKIANDANYDWGQDVKRLADFVKENKISSIAFDNFTGIEIARDVYKIPVTQLKSTDKDYRGWLALSTSVIITHDKPLDNYSWIVDKHPIIAKAGKSIFIYHIND